MSSVTLEHLEELQRRMADVETETSMSAPPSEKPKPKKAPAKRLKEGALYLTELNNKFPNPDLYFRVRDTKEFGPGMQAFVPDKLPLADYFFPPIFLQLMWEMLEHNVSCNAVGPPGCGKTTLLPVLCGHLNIPFMDIVGDREKDGSDFIGRIHIADGDTTFIEGPVVMALEQGGVLLYDEWAKTLPQHNSWLHPVADGRKVLDIPEHTDPKRRRIHLHKSSWLTLADNTTGGGDGAGIYSSVQQDQATLDRFDNTLVMAYPPADEEARLIMVRFPTLEKGIVNRIVRMANDLRKGWNNGVFTKAWTVRNSFAMAKKLSLADAPELYAFDAAGHVYVNKLPDEVEQQAASNMISNVFTRR